MDIKVPPAVKVTAFRPTGIMVSAAMPGSPAPASDILVSVMPVSVVVWPGIMRASGRAATATTDIPDNAAEAVSVATAATDIKVVAGAASVVPATSAVTGNADMAAVELLIMAKAGWAAA